jgi:hypothetical protein
VILWIAAYFFIRARQQCQLRREFEELAELDNERS